MYLGAYFFLDSKGEVHFPLNQETKYNLFLWPAMKGLFANTENMFLRVSGKQLNLNMNINKSKVNAYMSQLGPNLTQLNLLKRNRAL